MAASVVDEEATGEAACIALHAAALASLELGDLEAARGYLDHALAVSARSGAAEAASELLATSALLWFHAEQPERALAELDRAIEGHSGDARSVASLRGQRAHLLFRLGLDAEGLAESAHGLEAARTIPEGADPIEARLLSNRAIGHAYRGRFAEAISDLSRALDLHRRAGSELHAAQVLHNLGFVATRQGDIPVALRHFDEALAAYVRLGIPLRPLLVDRCELLSLARLVPEARRATEEAAAELERVGLFTDAAEARLSLADACEADGDPVAALAAAEAAEQSFERQGRPDWAVLARERAGAIRRAALTDHVAVSEAALASAGRLEASGWLVEGLEARVVAARHALQAGRADLVVEATAPPTSSPAGSSAGVTSEIARLHADGLWKACSGEVSAGFAELARAARLARSWTGSMHATTGVHGHGRVVAELGESGLALALAEVRRGAPADIVFEWAERSRLSPRWRERAGEPPPLESVHAGLGTGALVEYFVHDGELHALALSRGSVALLPAVALEPVTKAVASLLFGLGQLVRGRVAGASRAEMVALVGRAASRLDELVALPVAATTRGASRLVVVPAGPLHALAFSLLPSWREVTLEVASSAASCCAPAGPRLSDRRELLLVAAPGIPSARAELDAVEEAWREGGSRPVRRLVGAAASRDAVTSGLASCAVAHIAAHGEFRADNPMMSSLSCSDGPLTVYELAARRPSPHCVVLSACDGARVGSYPGEELAGAVPALLGFGTGAVVAGWAELPDAVMPEISSVLHRGLVAGLTAAESLRQVRTTFGDPLELLAADADDADGSAKRALGAASLACHTG